MLHLNAERPLKKLQDALDDPGIEVWFEDEVHFQLATTMTRMWALKGQQPEILSKPGRLKIGYFGAVNPATGELFVGTAYTFNSLTYQVFLDAFMAKHGKDGKRILLVIDNASWHKRAARKLAIEQPERFNVLFLPPYSPDLNPIERLWRLTRRVCTHNKYFNWLDDLAATLLGFFSAHAVPNDTLRSLCAIN